jgi:outer membrane lipoprotein-sorting protein
MGKYIIIILLLIPVLLPAESNEELLVRVDSLASYMDSDFSAEYTIVQSRPGQSKSTTVAGVFRRDAREQYVIIIMDPVVSRGQGYLKEGNMLYFYDPQSRAFNSTSSRERFQNSNASNSDFTRSTLAKDYRVESAYNELLGGKFNCRVLSLTARNNDVTYPKMKVWVSEDGLLRKTEDYSLSGQHLRTTGIPDYYKIDSRFVPKGILIVDELRGASVNGKFIKEQTQITIKNPSFKKLDNSYFSKAFLENVGPGGR